MHGETRRFLEGLAPFSSGETLDVGSRQFHNQWNPRAIFQRYLGLDFIDGPNVDLVLDAHWIPFPDSYFDNVMSSNTLEHDRDPKQTVHEMLRVLKPGGIFGLACPIEGYGAHEVQEAGGHYENPPLKGLLAWTDGLIDRKVEISMGDKYVTISGHKENP